MGQRVTGHGSSGSTNLSGSRGSRVKKCDPLSSLIRRWSICDFRSQIDGTVSRSSEVFRVNIV